MHWTLHELHALTPNQYDALVDWLNDQQRARDDATAATAEGSWP